MSNTTGHYPRFKGELQCTRKDKNTCKNFETLWCQHCRHESKHYNMRYVVTEQAPDMYSNHRKINTWELKR